jgi:uncharacterized membrane protein YfcA
MTNRDFQMALLGLFMALAGFIGALTMRVTDGPTFDKVYYLVIGLLGIGTVWGATRDKKNEDKEDHNE